MSYSVTEQFPDGGLLGLGTEPTFAEGLEVLRRDKWPELKRKGFPDFRFGDGMDLLQLDRMVHAK